MKKTHLLVCALIPFFSLASVSPVEQVVDRKFAARWKLCYAEKTSLFYGCPPERVKKADKFKDGIFDWYKGIPGGYGEGMGDCALTHGVALSGCVDRWEVLARRGLKPSDPKMQETADWGARLAQGLLNLSSRHRFKGFVARGLCYEDGTSICSLSSIDQHTHWVHGLWRYVHSPMARPEIVAEWKVRIVEVAERMVRTVTPESNYNFGLCDGRPDPRGICTMWWPDKPNAGGSCRLAAIYAAAYDATGDVRWRDRYERLADKASADATQALVARDKDPARWRARAPAYVLLQANSGLEVLLDYETSPRRKADLRLGMSLFAEEADYRVKVSWKNPKKTWYGMCSEGELALVQLMAENRPYDEINRAYLAKMLLKPSQGWSSFQAAHYFAAYWRAARRGISPEPDLAATCDAAWARMMATRDPKTGVVLGFTDLSKSAPPTDATNNFYRSYKGRPGGVFGPRGVGDAPLICGTALAGLVDRWLVTHDPQTKADAAKVAEGVLNLAVLHGRPGFVCRGFCSDGKTTTSLSSRDQYTHWIHGLWRYVTAPGLADANHAAAYKKHVVEVARFMEERVTAEHAWNFGLADSPEKDYRGICTMWGDEIYPHEAARLPMIYLAAHLATADVHWLALYEKFIDEALDRTLALRDHPERKFANRMPCYSLYQANVSLEPIYAYERTRNPARTARLRDAMGVFAQLARQRAAAARRPGAKEPYGMCWDGELLLTQLMDPSFAPSADFEAFLTEAVLNKGLATAGLCRVAHIFAAYWRARAFRAAPRQTAVTAQAPAAVSRTAAGTTLVDFGKAAFGWLELVAPEKGTGAYEVRLGEKLTADGRVDLKPGGTIRSAAVTGAVTRVGVHRVPLVANRRNTEGQNALTAAQLVRLDSSFGVVMPFRYAEFVRAPFALHKENVVRQAMHWPIDMTASSFRCSSEALTRVYDLCKYSIWATSFAGVYVDGDRERIPYEADAYLNQLGHYAVEADGTLARRTFAHLVAHPTWPTEWKQHMIMMAWADWMWTGSTELIARHYGLLRDEKLLLDKARADGLVVTSAKRKRSDEGDLVDWPPAERDGFVFRDVNAVINAFHYRNLREMADIASALGKTEDAKGFTERAARVKDAFNRVFFRPDAGLYADGEGTDHASLHANAAALAFGLVPEKRMARVADFLEQKGMVCSVYFAQYLLEALYAAGRDAAALRLMTATGDRSWLGMLEQGSTVTLEAWNLKAKPNLDWNHAWGTPPLNVIARYVLGVRPTKPGFAEYEVKPRLGGLTGVEGVVPSPRGPIVVRAGN